jgi:hypothetical protein
MKFLNLMSINCNWTLNDALERIEFIDGNYGIWIVSETESVISGRELRAPSLKKNVLARDDIITRLSVHFKKEFDNLWGVVGAYYGRPVEEYVGADITAFFSEANRNALMHSSTKMVHRMHLWIGAKSFVFGIEQKGEGFDALMIDRTRTYNRFGHGFDEFRRIESQVFFDDARNARTIFMEQYPPIRD